MGKSWSLIGRRSTRALQPGLQLAGRELQGARSGAWRMWWSQASALRCTCCVHRSPHPPLEMLDLGFGHPIRSMDHCQAGVIGTRLAAQAGYLLALSSGGAFLGAGHAERCA